ncbi:MAG: hypothetical protein ACKO6K_07710 [Chitinophagaceae bacterium]
MRKAILSWVLFLAVILINALANSLPINGLNTGQISAFYPNYFVPAGFTFAIWGILYLQLLIFTIAASYFLLTTQHHPEIKSWLQQLLPLYWLTCVFNIGWIVAWHYLQILLSVVIMLALLATLIKLFLVSTAYAPRITWGKRFCLYTPFVTYLAWVCVATIANITALCVAGSKEIGESYQIGWSVLMMIIALGLTLFITLRYKVISFGLVIAWAFWGIQANQSDVSPLLEWIPKISIVIIFATGIAMGMSQKWKSVRTS